MGAGVRAFSEAFAILGGRFGCCVTLWFRLKLSYSPIQKGLVRMTIRNIKTGVEWPGQIGLNSFGTDSRWRDLKEALNKLYVGGPAVVFEFDNKRDADNASSTVFGYAKAQNSKLAGWNYKTTVRPQADKAELYVCKIPYKASR